MQKVPIRVSAARFAAAVKFFATSNVGWKAKLLFAMLVVLLLGVNALNVGNSYVGRNFMSAIQERNRTEFIRQAIFYVGVFAGSTVVAVIARFAAERLGLLWRDFVTRRGVTLYLFHGAYYHLNTSGELTNPDQRIAEDMRAFTVTTLVTGANSRARTRARSYAAIARFSKNKHLRSLDSAQIRPSGLLPGNLLRLPTLSFTLMLLNSSFTIIAFSGVLWSINPPLFVVSVLYAAAGSFITILLARPLVKLNYDQLDKDASFHSELLQVRQQAESIFVERREGQHAARLLDRLDSLVAKFSADHRHQSQRRILLDGLQLADPDYSSLDHCPGFYERRHRVWRDYPVGWPFRLLWLRFH
jgi:putative ATP-binding cassette transporter